MKKLACPPLSYALILVLAFVISGCGGSSSSTPGNTNTTGNSDTVGGTTTTAVLHTSMGDITLELYNDQAPITVENFVNYVNSGFYDNTIFHRVIESFMIQGGGFTSGMVQKSTNAPIQNEANNGLSNLRGTIAMARTDDTHSATSQFFINVVDNTALDYVNESNWGYAVFGRVIQGMDTVDAIRMVQTYDAATSPYFPPHVDVPVNEIIITSAEILAP